MRTGNSRSCRVVGVRAARGRVGATRLALALAFLCVPAVAAWATPPEYATFQREQSVDVQPDARHLMRIWAVYSGQGDSFLVQLPPAFDQTGQSIEMLVDGGPQGQQLVLFLKQLLGNANLNIEHAVLTHHDLDHVGGLTSVLKRNDIAIGSIYHNGLVSWTPASARFAAVHPGDDALAVIDGTQSEIKRAMAMIDDGKLRSQDLIRTLAELRAIPSDDLHGIYRDFAVAVSQKTAPAPVSNFQAVDSTVALPTFVTPQGAPAVTLTALWPPPERRVFQGNGSVWAYTINGNSVTFRLNYGDFEMLFTGDQNDASETELLKESDAARLKADVLKVPHHGSSHSLEQFVKTVDPVVSVASMGKNGYGHPAVNAIQWAGGPHRVYSTHIHERKFAYANNSKTVPAAMVEGSHVLIETDGTWFRVVETNDPTQIPPVKSVSRGNGTRWIKART